MFDCQTQCHIPLIWALGRQRQKYVVKFKTSQGNSDSMASQSGPVERKEESHPWCYNVGISESGFSSVCQFVSLHERRACSCMCVMGCGTASVFVTICVFMYVCVGTLHIWECDYVSACDCVTVSASVLGL